MMRLVKLLPLRTDDEWKWNGGRRVLHLEETLHKVRGGFGTKFLAFRGHVNNQISRVLQWENLRNRWRDLRVSESVSARSMHHFEFSESRVVYSGWMMIENMTSSRFLTAAHWPQPVKQQVVPPNDSLLQLNFEPLPSKLYQNLLPFPKLKVSQNSRKMTIGVKPKPDWVSQKDTFLFFLSPDFVFPSFTFTQIQEHSELKERRREREKEFTGWKKRKRPTSISYFFVPLLLLFPKIGWCTHRRRRKKKKKRARRSGGFGAVRLDNMLPKNWQKRARRGGLRLLSLGLTRRRRTLHHRSRTSSCRLVHWTSRLWTFPHFHILNFLNKYRFTDFILLFSDSMRCYLLLSVLAAVYLSGNLSSSSNSSFQKLSRFFRSLCGHKLLHKRRDILLLVHGPWHGELPVGAHLLQGCLLQARGY